MRLNDDAYIFANPFLEPVGLETLIVFDKDDLGAVDYPIADPRPDGEDLLELAETQAAIQNFISGLGATDRELLHRVFWRDESQADVARRFGVSGAAISKRMHRITRKARVALAALQDSQVLH